MNGRNQPQQGMQLFDAKGRRFYFSEEERRAFVATAKAPREVRTFCGTLHATGCRISEALALTAPGFTHEPGWRWAARWAVRSV